MISSLPFHIFLPPVDIFSASQLISPPHTPRWYCFTNYSTHFSGSTGGEVGWVEWMAAKMMRTEEAIFLLFETFEIYVFNYNILLYLIWILEWIGDKDEEHKKKEMSVPLFLPGCTNAMSPEKWEDPKVENCTNWFPAAAASL